MNSKLRSDSVFAQLNNEQMEMLEDWLFEEKLGYKEVLEKAKQEWDIKTSLTALGRFYRRLALQRSEERRLETVALCLEGLAAKNDGTLQAGLLALANQCAIEFLVEQPKSIREFTGMLRALTSAGVFEMKHVEFQRAEEGLRQREIEQKKEEEYKRQSRERWYQREEERRKLREEKRQARLAAKAAAEAAARETTEPPEGGTPNEASAAEPEHRLAAGLVVGECPKDTMSPVIIPMIERTEDFTINPAGNPEKPLKTH